MFRITSAAALALPCLFPAAWAQEKTPSVDEIVAHSIEARGGMAKIKGLQTLRMTGTATLNDQVQASVRFLSKRPNLTRFEMDVNGITLVQAFDGRTAWSINPFAGGAVPQAAPEVQSRELREHSDMDGPLVDYKTKGRKVELESKEDVSGAPAWKLKVTQPDGGVDYIYLDTTSYLMVRSASTHIGATVVFGDYRTVEGLVVPFRIEQSAPPGTVDMKMDKVEINVPMNDTQFRMKK